MNGNSTSWLRGAVDVYDLVDTRIKTLQSQEMEGNLYTSYKMASICCTKEVLYQMLASLMNITDHSILYRRHLVYLVIRNKFVNNIIIVEGTVPRGPLCSQPRNKSLALKDHIADHDLDLFAVTETWLRPGGIDNYHIEEFCPSGYTFYHIPRDSSRGRGVGLLTKKSIQVRKHTLNKFDSFEYMDVLA